MLTTRRLLPTAAVALLTLTGCTAGDSSAESPSPTDATSAPADASPSDEEPDATETETPAEPEPAPEETETADAGGLTPGDTACLQGTWVYTAAEVEATFDDMMSNVEGSPVESVSVEGDSYLTFDGSSMKHEYEPPQVLTVEAGAASMTMEMIFTWSGHTKADFEVEGNMFRVTSMETGDFAIDTRVLVDGKEMDGLGDMGLGDLMAETGRGLPEGQVEFACGGDTLRLTAVAPEDANFRFDYELTRK